MDMENSIAFVVRNLFNQFHRHMLSVKANFLAQVPGIEDITESQGHIVGYLYEKLGKETIYHKDIEKKFTIRRSTATVMLKRMEKAGLILRRTSDDDGRLKTIVLTEKALGLHPIAKAEILKAERQAKKGLTAEEVETFLRLAKKITQNIS